jgi:hypothetical protein
MTANNSFKIDRIRNTASPLTGRLIASHGSATGKNWRQQKQKPTGGNMALKRRGKTWHCHFVVNGQRFRQSLETTDWREAQAKEKELIAAASEGKLHQTSTTLARQPFGLAADDYVTARKLELALASQAKEKQLLVQLRALLQTGTAESDHGEADHRVPGMAGGAESWTCHAQRGVGHSPAHLEAGETLGACC